MTVQTCIWHPPSCCGCQLRITGDFNPGSVENGISYQHPTPYTITALEIVNCCADHDVNCKSMMDASVFFEVAQQNEIHSFLAQSQPSKRVTPKTYQARGYLKYPIDNPTPAQCLYTFLSQYAGTKNTQPCGCTGHLFRDEQGNVEWRDHPKFTGHCDYHIDDTHDLQQARADCIEFAAQQEKALSAQVAADVAAS